MFLFIFFYCMFYCTSNVTSNFLLFFYLSVLNKSHFKRIDWIQPHFCPEGISLTRLMFYLTDKWKMVESSVTTVVTLCSAISYLQVAAEVYVIFALCLQLSYSCASNWKHQTFFIYNQLNKPLAEIRHTKFWTFHLWDIYIYFFTLCSSLWFKMGRIWLGKCDVMWHQQHLNQNLKAVCCLISDNQNWSNCTHTVIMKQISWVIIKLSMIDT